ncbi:MAG: universal stress protein [Acidobacteriota bacterium]
MSTERETSLRLSTPRYYFSRILCPTNLSPDSDEALRYALALARVYDAKLYVCHCVEEKATPDWSAQIKGLGHIKGLFEESLGPRIGVAELDKLSWEGLVVEGNPSEIISHEAAERHVDLIVMRSRRRPYAAALLGSTAEAICRNAPCPVLVTHDNEREWVDGSTGEIKLKRVLVPYDFSDYSELALSYALSLAQEYQAELHILHVLPEQLQHTWYPHDESTYHQIMRRLQYAVPREAHLWCQIHHEVTTGHPYQQILAYAEENHIDLISMGARGSGFSKWALFGSNADRVLRQAPCPVLIARPLKPAINIASTQADYTKVASGERL